MRDLGHVPFPGLTSSFKWRGVYGEEAKKSLPKLLEHTHISPCHFTNGENVHAMVSKLKTSIAY